MTIARSKDLNRDSLILGYSYTSSVQSKRIVVAETVNRKTPAKEIAVDKSFGTLIAVHAVEDYIGPTLFIQSTYVWPNERASGRLVLEHQIACCNSAPKIGPPSRSRISDLWIVNTMASAAKTRSKKLVALKDRLNRLLAELEELCIGSADAYEVEEQVFLMEETFRAADALQIEVELDLEGEERQAAIDDWAACRQHYRVGKSRARARMVEARGELPICSDTSSAGRPAVRAGNGRLPEVTLPKFSGKVLEFSSFCAQFEASIHKQSELDNAIKFTYLLSSREETARSAIEGIPLTPENYTQAVDNLKARFGWPRLVIREHLAALWRAPAIREMTARGIQSLVDEVTKHLRCLTALDNDPFAGRFPISEALMPMLQDKFPPALIRAWDTNIGPDAAEDEDNLQKFLEFAQWQASLLAKSKREDTKPSAAKSEQRTPSKKPSRSEWKYGDRIRSTAAALAVVTARSCPFCSGEHKAEECEKRICPGRETVRTKEVCFRCLEIGHLAKRCREGRHCGVDGCRQPHHKLLHPSSTTESARSPGSDRAHQGILPMQSTTGKGLQTAPACAYGPNGNHVVVNCLLDTGAAISFIRKDVAKALGLTGRFTTLGGFCQPSSQLTLDIEREI
ncbi:zinc knuckle protein [Trichinella spiralis]|uniref:zinc knuckle protein n=1 Tax=Trichinella spiralis TaxID=6334 RepID=UPI0001EFDE1B|nr:zinc knuckle protein [Trichinella spiralis]